MKKIFIFIAMVIFITGCSPLHIRQGTKPLGKLNLGKTQIDIEGQYSGDIYSPKIGKESIGKINIGGTMRDLK